MDYIRLGSTGMQVSRICLGAMTFGTPDWRPWVLTEEASRPIIRRAVEHGINFFDTADMYSTGASEEVLGRALKDFTKRDQVVLATKVFFRMGAGPNDQGLSRKHIMDAIDRSLRRLGTEYVDLYQIHRWDKHTRIEETMEALHDVVKAGKARYIGASSMYVYQFATAQHVAERNGWTKFVSMQNHYNLIYREEEREMIPYCREQGIGIIPWSPLARGFLSGSRARNRAGETIRSTSDAYATEMYFQEADFQVLDRVVEVARKRGVTPSQIAFSWLLHQPGVTAPILGVTKMQHLDEAVSAVAISLSSDERLFLESAYVPHRTLGHS